MPRSGPEPKAVRCQKHFEVAGFIEGRAGDRTDEWVALLAEHYGRAAALGEEAGLEAVLKNPADPYYIDEELGGRSYFTAIYADRATLPSCVSCHNQHPLSPRKDFKQGDVMGAIVVRVPLEF